MKPGVPWSVKGIDAEAREAAKEAARRSGKTLGEWLNNAIADQMNADPEGAPMPGRPMRNADSFERAANRLETIAEQLASIARRDSTAAAYVYQPETRQAESEQFTRILSRVEANERSHTEGLAAINDRIATLGRQITQANRAAVDFKPEEHPSYQALEKAMRNIVEHLEVSDKRTKDNLKSLQDRMTDMATRAASSSQENVQRHSPAISMLEQRLSELSQKVDQVHSRPQLQQLDPRAVLHDELTALAERIDTVRDTAESLAARAQTQAVQASQKELQVIEGRILGLLQEAQSAFAKGGTTPADLLRIRSDIENLNKRIDATQQPSTVDAEVKALKSVVDQMSSRMAQGPDMRPVVELHKRVNEIAKRIEQVQTAPVVVPQVSELEQRIVEIARRVEQVQTAPVVVPQVSELEQRIVELDQRLNAAMHTQHPASQNDVMLEKKIAEVAERMDRTEQQLSHLGTIEKAINQLYDGLEANRVSNKEAAEEAARAAITQFAGQFTAPQIGNAPEIIALQQGLNVIQESAKQSEGRNQETLLALHETLEHIVGKLGELETAAIGQRMAVAVEQDVSAAAHVAHVSAAQAAPAYTAAAENPFADAFASSQQAAQHQDVVVETTPEPIELKSPLADTEPLSAVQAAAAAAGNDPFQTSAAPFSVDNAAASAPSPLDPASGGDFIAAARRSAQAAQAAKSGSLFSGMTRSKPTGEPKEKKAATSVFDRFKRSKTDKVAAVEDQNAPLTATPAQSIRTGVSDKFAQSSEGPRKKLIIAGVAILSLVGILMFSMTGNNQLTLFPKLEKPATSNSAEPSKKSIQPVAPPLPAMKPEAKLEQIAPVNTQFGENQVTDEILTGSLPGTQQSVADVVVGKTSPVVAELPPENIGPNGLRQAAAQGNPRAQFVVATRYMNGENIERDFAQAAYWYGKAAASGLAPAQYRVATLYERGKGVERDMKAALGWYERAASLGNVRAMHNAAVIAAGKDAGAPDYDKAFKWFSLASAYGLKDSQFNLAVLLERGLGTKPQPEEALFWYYVAAKQNDADAAQRASNLVKSVSPDIAERARHKADTWIADRSSDAANVVAVDDSAWQGNAG